MHTRCETTHGGCITFARETFDEDRDVLRLHRGVTNCGSKPLEEYVGTRMQRIIFAEGRVTYLCQD